MTVLPGNVISNMNKGSGSDYITSEQHAKSVVDRLGWEKETAGHVLHNRVTWMCQSFLYKIFRLPIILADREKKTFGYRKLRGQE